jgi:serine/threonine protein kinase
MMSFNEECHMQEELDKVWSGWKIDEEPLGEGAFGKVYRIQREEFGHIYEAALKVITIPKSQAELKTILNDGMDKNSVTMYFSSIVEDMVEEFTLMSQLKGNTNIVSYEDHAVVPFEEGIGWTIYIRMELLTPLLVYLKQKKLCVRDVISLGIDMCNALEVCQKYNIIHRDIKPENIFVSKLGRFKLGDFGIARQLEKTSSGMSKKGTYTYMAPEVYKGQAYNSTVDIYSLGIVLYRYLNNNRTPFLPAYPAPIRYSDKERANVMRMSGMDMPKPCNAEGRLAEIILKACSFEPKDRYESAVDMRRALEAIIYEESETMMIYPKGDVVQNSNVEYIFTTEKNDPEAEIKTKYLFPQTEIISGNEDIKKEKIVSLPSSNVPDVNEPYQREKKENKHVFIILGIVISIIMIGIIIFVLVFTKTSTQHVYDLINQGNYSIAYQEIGELYDKNKNVDSLVFAFAEECAKNSEYKRAIVSLEYLSSEAETNKEFFDTLIEIMLSHGKVNRAYEVLDYMQSHGEILSQYAVELYNKYKESF